MVAPRPAAPGERRKRGVEISDESAAGVSPAPEEIAAAGPPSVARSTALMSVSTAASRVTGFVRTWAMALALGVSFASTAGIPIASSYNIANNIPNMIYELVAGGVISSMLIPIYIEKLRRDGRESAERFANTLFMLVLVFLGAVALFGTLVPQPFVLTQTFTVSREKAELAVSLFRFFAVQIVFYGWFAVATGVLNSDRRFFAPAIAPLVNNVVVIVTLLGFYLPLRDTRPDLAIASLGIGTTLGVVSMLVTVVPSLLKTGFRFRLSWDLKDPSLRTMVRKAVPVLVYVVVNLLAVSFRNAFATSAFLDGSAALTYAWMWYQLPYGVLAVAYITAVFPELSEMADAADWQTFKATYSRGLRVLAVLILPAAGMLAALSTPLVTLYRSGAFTEKAVPLVAGVLTAWACGLIAFAVYMLTLRAFYAQQDTLTPMWTNLALMPLHVGLYWVLTTYVGSGDSRLLGIPAADAIFYAAHAIVLIVILRARRGGIDGRRVAWTYARTIAASAAAAGVAWALVQVTPVLAATRLGALAQTVAGGALGLGVAYGLAHLMGVEEVHDGAALLRGLGGRLKAKARP
jgi:putative peptidoglycan lipid II flippase